VLQQSGSGTKRPYVFTFLIVATIASVNLVSARAVASLPDLPAAWLELLTELVLAVVAIVLVTARRAWRTIGFRALPSLKDFRLYWVPVLPLLPVVGAVFTGVSRMRIQDALSFLVLACVIGFVEEVFFRGLILQALASRGLWRASTLSSIVFGLMHLLNFLFGADFLATLLQVGYATAMGFGFAAVTLRTGALWPLILIHTLIDFAGFIASDSTLAASLTSTDAAIYTLYIFVFTAYGLFMMRAVKRNRMQPRDDSQRIPIR